MKELQKEVKYKRREDIPEVPRDSHSQSGINQRSQITSTQRIMSSTVTRRLSSAVSLTGQHSGSGRQSICEDVASAPSLSTFRRRLKTYLFQQSYPDVVLH